MQADFWHKKWANSETGFHQTEINGFLKNYWRQLNLTGSEAVLVPLCGKSLDMLWLAQQGHKVLGVELSLQALDEFLQENTLPEAKPVQTESHCGYQLADMTLLCGDFFAVSAADCESIQAVYDRAALVALPPAMRQDYAQHLKNILPTGVKILLVTMEYDQGQLAGPPFSVTEAEVQHLFGEFCQIELLHTETGARKGVTTTEKVYLLNKS
ncbi:thiopurine S-methyltransferase [Thiomicrorhabdus sediminis]|uniref:Thiopurine S-methyltransferase n=1 Tax=Thiomicrorhabdus sediminis TaxID=2580412 RepID=A0A4P9K701_9GAMM|nr:thiopurine S-methyltransferase [Thiomicrorhabdus sediminis]QCU90799.1 thiopurine S-methyltransferase [Thiomicrorhabdus sediminis]